MNQIQIDKINKSLSDNGRIFWSPTKGWTSKLWRELTMQGWRSSKSSAGYLTAYNAEGIEAVTGLGRVEMLRKLDELMR